MTSEFLRCLLAMTLAASAAIVVALAARRATRRTFGATAAYCIWLLVPIAIVAVLLPSAPEAGPAIGISFRIETVPLVTRATESLANPSFREASSLNWQAWLLGAWGAGIALCLLYLGSHQRAFVRSLGMLSGAGRVLRAARSVGCPALIGAFRPKVVLPADFKMRYSRLERRLVLAHERAHLRRGDARWNGLVVLLRCVFWFNPLVHWASGFFRLDQELACDAAVMEHYSRSRRIYASAMLKTQVADAALPVGCHWQSARQLKERLQSLKESTPSQARRIYGRVFVAFASAAVGCAAWAADPSRTTTPVTGGNAEHRTSDGDAPVSSAIEQPLTIQVGDQELLFPSDSHITFGFWASELPATHSPQSFVGRPRADYVTKESRRAARSLTYTGNVRVTSFFPQGHATITVRSSSGAAETLNALAITVRAEQAVLEPRSQPFFMANFEKGCAVTLTPQSGRERSLYGTVCRLQGYSAARLWQAVDRMSDNN